MRVYIKFLTITFFKSLLFVLLIISSKENSNYNKLRVITFSIGLIIIIFSEATIRLISKITFYDISIMIIPLVLISILYLFLLKQFDTNIKN